MSKASVTKATLRTGNTRERLARRSQNRRMERMLNKPAGISHPIKAWG